MDELRGTAAEAGGDRQPTEPAYRPAPRGWWQRLIGVLGRAPSPPAPVARPGHDAAARPSLAECPPTPLPANPVSDLVAVAVDGPAADAVTAARMAPAALQPRTPWAVRLDPARGSAE